MKLNYFDLLSPDPLPVPNVGGIISPTLKDISSIGYNTYNYYLTILSLDLKSYFALIEQPEKYELLTDEEKQQINIFDLLITNEQSSVLLQNILNFFIKEDVIFSANNHCFIVKEGNDVIGNITKDNYSHICDIISQRNCINLNYKDFSKVKNQKALEIMKKIEKRKSEKSKQTKADKNMELGNIISAVANKSNSLNILNIWDLTIYQVWDCFSRLSINSIYNIQSMSVATWGDKENHFDATAWFKKMNLDN